MKPVLSICIVVRNAADDLARTLSSLDRQLPWLRRLPAEVVLVDGDSTDDSFLIGQDWAGRSGLSVRLFREPPKGIYPAMNDAWSRAQGEWLLYINAGDLLLDAALLVDALTVANTSNFNSIQFESAVFLPRASWGLWIPGRYPACHQSLVYRRDLHRVCGPYDERLRICADRLFDQQISAHGRQYHPGVLSATQVSPANASRDSAKLLQDLTTIRTLGLPFSLKSSTWLTLMVLRVERWIGISLSVWLRLWLRLLMGRARRVCLG